MLNQQPVVTTTGSCQRRFATPAVAIQAIIINHAEEILLLSSPNRKQGWQVVSGALEASETLLDGTSREVYEELGDDIRVRIYRIYYPWIVNSLYRRLPLDLHQIGAQRKVDPTNTLEQR